MSHKRMWLVGLLALVALGASPRASADEVDFSWSGGASIDLCAVGLNFLGLPCPLLAPISTSSGTGSFTFGSGLTSIGLGDLTNFTFNESDVPVPLSGLTCADLGLPPIFCATTTYTFGLSDVNSLSATISNGSVTALSMMLAPVNGTLCCEGFTVTSLGAGAAFTADGVGNVLNTGEVTVTNVVSTVSAVPEPTSFLLLGTGLLGLSARLRSSKKRQISAT